MTIRRRTIVIALVAALVVIAGTAFLIVRPAWTGRCSASFGEIPAKELDKLRSVPLDQVKAVDFDPTYRPNVRALLDAAQHPVAPLGKARHAVVVPHENGSGSARLANSNDGDVRFVVGAAGLIGTASVGGIVQVGDETGRASWGRRQAGYAAGGGDADDLFVLMQIPRNKAPRVAAVDTGSGDLAWCTKLGKDSETQWRPTFDSAAAGDALFTVRAAEESEQDVRLSRIDTRSGDVTWDKPVEGVSQAGSVDLLGDQLLLSQPRLDSDVNRQQAGDRGAVLARSAADGAARWTYRGPDDKGWISNVVGTGKDVAVVVSRRPASGSQAVETWMAGIDRSGKQLWKKDIQIQNYSLSGSYLVTGDLVVSHETVDGKADTSILVARSLDTGAERWRTKVDGTSSPLRPQTSEVVGDSLVAAAYHGGLITVDLRNGSVSNPLPGKNFGPIDGIVSDGRTLTIDANGLFVTFDRAF